MPAPIDGRSLYEACRREGPGQAEAFQTLGRYLYQVAYNLVRGRAQLHDLAEDCSQEALITIWQSLSSVEDPDHFLGWSARVVINKVYDACRRLGIGPAIEPSAAKSAQPARRRRVPLSKQNSLEAIHDESGSLQDIIPAPPEASPEARQAQHELVQLLTVGIVNHPVLSRQSKIVLIRGFLNDWDDGVLAAELGASRSNVHTIRSRDLAHLRADPDFLRLLDEYMKD